MLIQEIVNQPWFEPAQFGSMYGAIVGGGGGAALGIFGGIAGQMVQRGKGRRFVLGAFVSFVLFGIVNLVVGLTALFTGQPYGIWFPFLLCGVIFPGVAGPLIPVLRRRYDEVEQRRMHAEEFRSG